MLTRLEPDPEALWLEARPQIRLEDGLLAPDDSTLGKRYARKMGLVGWHWSGNPHAVAKGINLLTLLWTDGDRHIPADYRIYDEAHAGFSKNDLFVQQLPAAKQRGLRPKCVCFDSWYRKEPGEPEGDPRAGLDLAVSAQVQSPGTGGLRRGAGD